MSLDPTPLLVGERVRLSALEMDDAKFIAQMDSDPYFARRMSAKPFRASSEKQKQDMVQRWIEDKEDYFFAVRTVSDNTFIGVGGLFNILWTHKTAWIMLGISTPERRGKGYGREVITILINYGFRELNLHRIQLYVFSYNEPAIALYEKIGFVYEGTMREYLHRDGQRFDMLIYGLLRREWETRS